MGAASLNFLSLLAAARKGGAFKQDLGAAWSDAKAAFTEKPIIRNVGGIEPVHVGQAGERAAGISGNKYKIKINGRSRIPDGLTEKTLTEVKNVKSLSYTRQLRDFADYAKREGLNFELVVRQTTKLSGPLNNAILNGEIILRYLR